MSPSTRIISRHRWGTFGAMIILLFMLIGLFADLLAPHQVWDTLRDSNGKLAIMRPPSAEFLLGTTAIGRDILEPDDLRDADHGPHRLGLGVDIDPYRGQHRVDCGLLRRQGGRSVDALYRHFLRHALSALPDRFDFPVRAQYLVRDTGDLLHRLAHLGARHPRPRPYRSSSASSLRRPEQGDAAICASSTGISCPTSCLCCSFTRLST